LRSASFFDPRGLDLPGLRALWAILPQTDGVIAILGGLGAAVMWASATLTSSRAGRLIGASSTLAWMTLIGLTLATPLALASGPLPTLTPELTWWAACSGLGGVAGLTLVYRGLRLGKVGVVAALASTEGAIAALIAVAAGERMNIAVGLTLVVIVGGVAVVALATDSAVTTLDSVVLAPEPGRSNDGHSPARRPTFGPEQLAALCGAGAAVCFGISIYGTAKLGAEMTPLMAVLPVRIAGVAAVFIPLALAGRLRLTRSAVPMVVWIGVAEVLGNVSYVIGSGESIAIAAVLGSQFAAVAAVAAFVLFHERLSFNQRWGVVVIAVGVAVLTLVRG
jgi:drug/metabolite transporter (DMT)-like permease